MFVEQEPRRRRREVVVDHVAFRQAAGGHHDRVHIVVRRAGAQFRLRQTDGDRLKGGGNHKRRPRAKIFRPA